MLYAKTAPDQGSHGITAFIVSTPRRGFSSGPKLDKLGMRGSNTAELVLEDVFVPHKDVLGEVNHGVRVLMEGLDLERLVLSAGPLGLMQAVLDVVLPYTHTREQFGKPIAHNQLVQGKLADMHTKLQASKTYTYDTAKRIDEEGVVKTQDCAGAVSALHALSFAKARYYLAPISHFIRESSSRPMIDSGPDLFLSLSFYLVSFGF